MFKKLISTLVIAALLGAFAGAQDDSLDDTLFGGGDTQEQSQDESSSDDLFGDSLFTEIKEDPNANPADDLLTSDKVVIGGDFGVTFDVNLALNPEEDEDSFTSGLTDLTTGLFLDARPVPEFRAFVKGDLFYNTTDGVSFDLREVFADITIADTVYVRAGKQTVNWGVGFFFSPANLINLETIDPENPDAELAGPVAVKAQVPIDSSNATGYLLLNDIGDGNDIGVAARYEFLVEGYELTVGGVYRPENPWAVMATATGAISDVTVFGEIVLEGNSNKVFIVEDPGTPLGYSTTTSDALYGSATLGARYSYTTEDELYTVSGSAQYLFNGLGYEDPSVFTDNPQVVAALLRQGDLGFSDLSERGQHYLAANISSPEIAGSDFNPSALWVANLSDGSGFLSASVNYGGIDYITPSLSYRFNYGVAGAEYSPQGDKHSLSLSLDISGSF